MIKEITQKEITQVELEAYSYDIFPIININCSWNYMSIVTLACVDEVNNYYVSIRKNLEPLNHIDYTKISKFFDSIMTDITKLKKEFNEEIYRNNDKLICYKIIK